MKTKQVLSELGRSYHRRDFVLSLMFAVVQLTAFAQSYSVDWFKVSGGGGTSTNGQYTLSGTVGEHDAGNPMTGGSYSLIGGFWSLIFVVQTPGAPLLYINRSGNVVTVFWQSASGWSLEQNGDLTSPAGWSPSGGVTNSNGTNYLSQASPTGNLFFRLKQQ
jgi:hypothetical protein